MIKLENYLLYKNSLIFYYYIILCDIIGQLVNSQVFIEKDKNQNNKIKNQSIYTFIVYTDYHSPHLSYDTEKKMPIQKDLWKNIAMIHILIWQLNS